MFLSVLAGSYKEEQLEGGDKRVVLNLPPALAPIKCAVLPLLKKDGLPEKAQAIMNELKFDFRCAYEEKDTIGKRYRRQDAIGTPFCITVDHQTLEDNTVTVRYRDTMAQERISVDAIHSKISEAVSMRNLYKKMMQD
jgi:glycyl-tRNA synthetase